MQWHDFTPLIAALFPTLIALYIYKQNRKNELAKEQLKNLYIKLQSLYENEYSLLHYKIIKFRDNNKIDNDALAIELYNFFLKLRKTYLDNQIYGSLKLRNAFSHLLCNHKLEIHNAMNELDISEYKNYVLWVAKFEFNHSKDNNDLSEMERYLEKIENIVNEDIYTLIMKKPIEHYCKESFREKFVNQINIFMRK